MGKNRRRKYLINPRLQLTFVAYSVLISLVVGGVFYGAIHYFFFKLRQLGLAVGLAPDHVFFEFIAEQAYTMNWIFAVALALIGVVLFVGGLVLSHRLAGPLYRLHKHMQAVARGETTDEVRFRKGDYFPELEDAYNKQLKRLRG